MAEQFSNSLLRAVGNVITKTGCTIGAASTEITVTANTDLEVGQLIDDPRFLSGTKIHSILGTTINADRVSTNSIVLNGETVNFLGVATAYTAPIGVKAILVGGTFANNKFSQVELTIHVTDSSTGVSAALANKIPVPTGSSFVISDAGKTVIEGNDTIEVYCNSDNAIDVNLSILTGVS